MYKLLLLDGSTIDNLRRINPSTFELDGDNSLEIYFKLNERNLTYAILFKDNIIDDVFINYTKNNFVYQNNIISFRISPIPKFDKLLKHML